MAPEANSARRRMPSLWQGGAIVMIIAALSLGLAQRPQDTIMVVILIIQAGFVLSALWRAALAAASLRKSPLPSRPERWPRYTVLAALYDEAAVTPQLIRNLARFDYPSDKLEGFLVLEADDHATLAAAQATPRPAWLKIHIVPAGSPRTKPRALNHALSRATGEVITIYDAEDAPDPRQLKAAAARLMSDPRIGGVQAPLRIRRGTVRFDRTTFLDRQFAFEYGALFEVNLPGLARLGLPFPLGGTSNHIRAAALRGVGGWDAYNVTEDADLGFKLWAAGWKLDAIAAPTWETPPGALDRWLPQRTRWLKGYMQTWGVHTRRPLALGNRGLLALVMTLGMAVVSAASHAPTLAWLASALLIGLHAGVAGLIPLSSLGVLAVGVIAAWMSCAVGARRMRRKYRFNDMMAAPLYWSLLSLAFVHAAWRLVLEPHVWDKTPHDIDVLLIEDAGREAA